ncbi:hypothetical protein Tco_0205594 [Tanacetum coccineum]
MQVTFHFFNNLLQPEWSRFVTVVKQSKEIDTISYHTLFDILKQYQNEVNDIRAERIAKSANPLALLATAQPYSDNYYQAPKPQRSNVTSSSTRPSASTRHKGKRRSPNITHLNLSHSIKPTKQQPSNFFKPPRTRAEDTTPSFMQDSEVLHKITSSTEQPLEQVQNNDENNVFANERQHSENNTAECADERVALANLIANLTLDTEENKTILKQLKKANASLTQELEECKTNLDETSRALGEATSCRDSCLIALQNKQNELEKYIAFNDRTMIRNKILKQQLNDTLSLLALKDLEMIPRRYLNDVNARTKKPNVVSIGASKPKRKANRSVATPHKKTVASDTLFRFQEPRSEDRMRASDMTTLTPDPKNKIVVLTKQRRQFVYNKVGSSLHPLLEK